MKTKKLLAMVLAVLMIFSSISALSLTASASGEIAIAQDIDLTITWPKAGTTASDGKYKPTVTGVDTDKFELDYVCFMSSGTAYTTLPTGNVTAFVILKAKSGYYFTNANYGYYSNTVSVNSTSCSGMSTIVTPSMGTNLTSPESIFTTDATSTTDSENIYLRVGSFTVNIESAQAVNYTAATTAPEFFDGVAKTATIGTIAATGFSGTVDYTTKVYTTESGTDEATEISATVDGTDLKVTTTADVKQGTYYVDVAGEYETASESASLKSRIAVEVVGAYLDLEDDATYSDTKDDIAQNYTITDSSSYTGKTKVKLTWTVTDIDVTIQDDQVWNPDKLQWESTNNATASATDGSATFSFDNMSSCKIYANASFAVEDSLKSTFDKATFDDNDIELKTVVGKDNKVDKSVNTTGSITATVEVKDAEFKGKSATTEATKYGTYTVTITDTEPTVKVTFNATNCAVYTKDDVQVTSVDVPKGSTFNCDIKSYTFRVNTNSQFDITFTKGTTTVTYVVKSTAGEVSPTVAWTIDDSKKGTSLTEDTTINIGQGSTGS